jgi:hypothetical protein
MMNIAGRKQNWEKPDQCVVTHSENLLDGLKICLDKNSRKNNLSYLRYAI